MKDSWCEKLPYNGKDISGGAARYVRISRAGGMDNIIAGAVRWALECATAAVPSDNKSKILKFRKRAA